ncbi:hypothetical protein RQP46_009918 [Phenoliferia psychrophenolica]
MSHRPQNSWPGYQGFGPPEDPQESTPSNQRAEGYEPIHYGTQHYGPPSGSEVHYQQGYDPRSAASYMNTGLGFDYQPGGAYPGDVPSNAGSIYGTIYQDPKQDMNEHMFSGLG